MKAIVTVNTLLPTVEDNFSYHSGKSLLDYDIVLFNPKLPQEERINFNGGGSCISIEGTKRLHSAMAHWSKEFDDALQAGKTIFVILAEHETDQGAESYTTIKNSRSYNTSLVDSYGVLPVNIKIRNAKGKQLKIADNRFKGLHDAIKDIIEYKVVFTSEVNRKTFTTKDGSVVVSAIIKPQNRLGNLVLLPYFDCDQLTKYNSKKNQYDWTEKGIQTSKIIVNQFVELDKVLRNETLETPKPEWLSEAKVPKKVSDIEKRIQKLEDDITTLKECQQKELTSKKELLEYSALLYENGKQLELVIERSLQLMGYTVQNFREGDLEIDHIITHANGIRMIGESEGKDNAAIDISKFRQLETNINEDFSREDVSEPAKGLLFGNGLRLTEPSKRSDQFTQKCLTNAKRLGTALIKTIDLYEAVLYILDNPNDNKFKAKCRKAIETTRGYIVEFPTPLNRNISKL